MDMSIGVLIAFRRTAAFGLMAASSHRSATWSARRS
jgi:hypothetical protein